MIDPTVARRRIAAARQPGTDARPNPDQDEVPDLPTVLLGYVRQARLQAAGRPQATPDTVHVYERPDARGLRTGEPWCATALAGNLSTTTRHPTRGAADEHAAYLMGAKTS